MILAEVSTLQNYSMRWRINYQALSFPWWRFQRQITPIINTRFSLNLVYNDKEYNLGDGGFVDWGQKLTGNYKERMLISGIGIELLLKLQHGLI